MSINLKKHNNAFTMLELIFVIVILGIVASIGSSVIVKVYESYIIQRALHNASLKTELAVNILANRLVHSIDTSVVARVPGNYGSTAADMVRLRTITLAQAQTHRALEWIGYDNDGFTARNNPDWSGFVDLDHVNTTPSNAGPATLESTGSNFGNENTILGNLFPNMTNPAMLFMGSQTYAGVLNEYAAPCMYPRAAGTGCIFPVTLVGTLLTFTGASANRPALSMDYTEFYQLAGSAYAIVPEPDDQVGRLTENLTRVWDLFLYSDYQPWENTEAYNNGVKSLLLRNVSVFRFKQEDNSIRIKICSIESIEGMDISICKEKAVIR